MLLQLSAAGALLLQALQGQGARVQGEEQEDKGDPPHVSGRSVLQVKVKKVCVHIN